MIGLGGYASGAATQSASAENAVRIAAGGLPAAFFLGAVANMLMYPLTEKVFRTLVAETAERRAADAAAAGAKP
jgi:glucuronide carrier protein